MLISIKGFFLLVFKRVELYAMLSIKSVRFYHVDFNVSKKRVDIGVEVFLPHQHKLNSYSNSKIS